MSSAAKIILVEILRPAGQSGRGTGKVRTATGGYIDPPGGIVPIPRTGDGEALAGSPFPCRYYRKRQPFSLTQRDEAESGTTVISVQHVLSVRRPGADVRANDTLVLPKGTVFADRECRATIMMVRIYPGGIQCDLEVGAE